MSNYNNDNELFSLLETKLFPAVVGDVLDKMGYLHQFLPAKIQPLDEAMVLVGRAMPVLEADIYDLDKETNNPLAGKPFGLMLEALDTLKPGDIYVAAGGSLNYAMWGALMSTRAKTLGAKGALVNGYIRDSKDIKSLDFPAFGRGKYAQDQGPRGQVIDYNVTVEIAGIRIEPGALLFGDCEGVLVIPVEAEKEIIAKSLEKATKENTVEAAIKNGMSAVDAFKTYEVM